MNISLQLLLYIMKVKSRICAVIKHAVLARQSA